MRASQLLRGVGICVGLLACSSDPGARGFGGSGAAAGQAGNAGGVGGAAGAAGVGNPGGTGGVAGSLGGAGGTGGSAGGAGVAPSVNLVDECGAGNPAGLAQADLDLLLAGGSAGAMRVLYPYDGTVFPRGLGAPLIMWDGAGMSASAVYLHLESSAFEYRGCLTPTEAGQLQIPQAIWELAEAATQGASDPLAVELSALESGAVHGPVTEQIVIAQATLKGSIYYNSYTSALSANNGAVLRIKPGDSAELFVGGASPGCNGCHAVSANGARLHTTSVGGSSFVYELSPDVPVNPPLLSTNMQSGFVGLSPDGSVYMTSAGPGGGPALRASGTGTSRLFETDTGNEILASGIVDTALMGTFSPDGSSLVFNDNAINVSKGLAMMDWNGSAQTASGYRKIYESTDETKMPGWPFVLPDNEAVIFHLGTERDFSGGNVGISRLEDIDMWLGGFLTGIIPTHGPYGTLQIVDLDTGTTVMLAKAMGYATPEDAASKTTYLPFPEDDLDQSYYPTVSPVAAGGYFWVFFDSMRHYGNRGLHRQLWGTAITISPAGEYTSDPSHPPFFLNGQEEGTGNHRAFTALDPCRAEGQSCETGIDCCGGFCTDGLCDTPEMDDPPRCAETDEACTTSADCCNDTDSCIAGFCGHVLVE